ASICEGCIAVFPASKDSSERFGAGSTFPLSDARVLQGSAPQHPQRRGACRLRLRAPGGCRHEMVRGAGARMDEEVSLRRVVGPDWHQIVIERLSVLVVQRVDHERDG